jgi:hypothetical protein
MKRAGSGRIARKIGVYDESESGSADTPQTGSGKTSTLSSLPISYSDLLRLVALTLCTGSVVKRPTFGKNKKRSSLRISFGAGDSEANEGESSSDAPVVTPKKSNLSRIAIERSAELRARSPLVSELPRAGRDEDRPTYSKDYLTELRKSTPSTPKDLKPTAEEEQESRALDIASKFGSSATLFRETTSAIPTEAEIQEKKNRRARLAKEQAARDDDEDRPWASDDDDEFRTHKNEISLRPKEKYAETRLVRDDEDIAEGFEEYVEDGNIALGRKAEREADRKRLNDMADLINKAERGSDDDSSDDSEAERNASYEAAQTRAGAYGKQAQQRDDRARTPPKMTPIPDLSEVIERLQADVTTKEQRKEAILNKLEELKGERARIAEKRAYLQGQLQKTGDEYEKLREEAGMAALPANGAEGGRLIMDRGLESLGTTPLNATPIQSRPEEQ